MSEHPGRGIQSALSRLQKAFFRRWEARVLVQLALTPSLRAVSLADKINDASEGYISRTHLDRQLKELVDQGLVRSNADAKGYKLYSLTQSGSHRVAFLLRLADFVVSSTEIHARRAQSDTQSFAEEWLVRIARSAIPIGISRGECLQILRALAEEVDAAAITPQVDPVRVRRIGERLLVAFRNPSVIGPTLSLILERLPVRLKVPEPEATARTIRLVDHISVGFAHALRDRTLNEQEAFHRTLHWIRPR